MEKQKITSLTVYDKDKNGNLLKTKDGRNYSRLVIKTDKHGDKSLSGFVGKITANWKVGDEVELKVTEVGSTDGKTYYNFEVPKEEDRSNQKLEQILNGITSIKLQNERIISFLKPKDNGLTSAGTKVPDFSEVGDLKYPDEETISVDDIPFD